MGIRNGWMMRFFQEGLQGFAVRRWMWLAVALATVLGAKLLLIGLRGSNTPYWDQWDGEAAALYVPYLNGTLVFSDLFKFHAEHSIPLSRMTALALLELTGGWNPIVQMIVNAGIHVIALAVILHLIRYTLTLASLPVVAGMAVVLFAVPFAWENTLGGFQSPFYFLALLSVSSVVLLVDSKALSLRWWCGLVLAVVSMGAMASGALTAACAAVVLILQLALGIRERGRAEWVSIALLIATSVVLLTSVPALPQHDALRADGPIQFLFALNFAAGWPVILPLGPFIAQAPILILLLQVMRAKLPATDPAWRLIAIAVWVAAQTSAVAYSRAEVPISSRYFDTYSLGILMNTVALFATLRFPTPWNGMRLNSKVLRSLWLSCICGFLVANFSLLSANQLFKDVPARQLQTQNLAAFIRSGDSAALAQPHGEIPYPDAKRLEALASLPLIRGILPPELGASEQERSAARGKLATHGLLPISGELAKLFAWLMGTALIAGSAALTVLAASLAVNPRRDDGSAAQTLS